MYWIERSVAVVCVGLYAVNGLSQGICSGQGKPQSSVCHLAMVGRLY